MKKTLILTHEYYPFKGGVARYVYNLFKFLPAEQYLVVTDHPEVKTQDNILNLKLKNQFIRPTCLFSFFKLRKIIKQQKIEQIFTPNILPLGSLAYALKIPYIISLHGLDINLALKNKPKLTKKILQQAKLILVNSQNTKNKIQNLNLGDKVKLFYPTIDLATDYNENKFKQIKDELKIKDNEIVLLSVGRLTHRKGQDLVIKALAELKDLPLRYFIVGRGQEADNLQQLITEHNLKAKVLILEQVADNELIYYYKLANIFVLPHRQEKEDVEGFGIVFLEAAANNLAIIAGNSGGVTEVLTNQKNALLIEPTVGELVKAIQLLINQPSTRQKLAQAAAQRSQEFPTAQEQSKKLADLL